MRKITKKNKSSFAIFSIAVVAVLGLVAFMLVQQIQAANVKEYPLAQNSILYDKKGDYIDVSADGKIKKLWTKDYQASLANGKNYDLGSHGVVRGGSELTLYGGGYKVYDDGSVKTLSTVSNLTNLTTPELYKLKDRQYLMVGNDIRLENDNVQLKGYVVVDIDKAGNAFLRNDKVNYKVVAPVILTNGAKKFNSATEVLTVGTVVTDLKKINGSTNEYDKIAANKPVTEKEESADKQEANKEQATPATNPGTNGNNGTAGGGGNNVAITGVNQLKQTINQLVGFINNSVNENKPNTADKTEPGQNSSIVLNGLSIGVNSMTADYYVSDLENNYASVFLKVMPSSSTDEKDSQTIQISKNEMRRQVFGLYPNKSYEVSIGYVSKKGEQKIVDSSIVRTKNITGDLYVSKVVSGTVYFNLKLDPAFKLDSAKVVVYADGTKDATMDADVLSATNAGGWSSSVKVGNETARSYKLVLEDAVYEENGVSNDINLNIETVFKNTWISKLLKSIFG